MCRIDFFTLSSVMVKNIYLACWVMFFFHYFLTFYNQLINKGSTFLAELKVELALDEPQKRSSCDVQHRKTPAQVVKQVTGTPTRTGTETSRASEQLHSV